MRRVATAILLLGPIIAIGLLPLRPLVTAVWPLPVEEVVFNDGTWVLRPVISAKSEAPDRSVAARTRPMSLVEVELVDGRRLHGYLIERNDVGDGEGFVILSSAPGRQQTLSTAELVRLVYPNDMTLADRFRLSVLRVRERDPLS